MRRRHGRYGNDRPLPAAALEDAWRRKTRKRPPCRRRRRLSSSFVRGQRPPAAAAEQEVSGLPEVRRQAGTRAARQQQDDDAAAAAAVLRSVPPVRQRSRDVREHRMENHGQTLFRVRDEIIADELLTSTNFRWQRRRSFYACKSSPTRATFMYSRNPFTGQ